MITPRPLRHARRTQRIERTARSAAPPALIYGMLLDRSTWSTWSPLERFEHEVDGRDGPNSVDAIGTFVTGRTRSREILVHLEPDRSITYRLLSGLPLDDYVATVRLEAREHGTEIRWESTFVGPTGRGWAYRVALRYFIGKVVAGLAAESSRRSGGPCRDQPQLLGVDRPVPQPHAAAGCS